MAPVPRPRGGGAGRRARRMRSAHASDAASGGVARTAGLRDCPLAMAARSGRLAASACWPPLRRAAATLRGRCDLRQRGKQRAG